MLNRQFWLRFGCCVVALSLSACTTKEIPQGTRVAVWEQASKIKPDVANGAARINIAAAANVDSWLQSEANAQHITPHTNIGTNFQKQWKADFGTGSSRRELLMAKPLVQNNVIYMLDAEGRLTAFKLKDGEEIWRIERRNIDERCRFSNGK